MNVVVWMAAGSFGSWLVAAALRPAISAEVFFGMLGPFLAVAGTWLVIERTCRVNPARLNSLMMAGFVAKMVFFGVYVAVVASMPSIDRQPFAIGFATYFVSLYAIEAVSLSRLFRRVAF